MLIRSLPTIEESSNTQAITEIQFSRKTRDGVTYILQTTLRFLRRQLLSQQTIVINELADEQALLPRPQGSTAAALLVLNRPSLLQPVSRPDRRIIEIEDEIEDEQEEQEQSEIQELAEQEQPRLRLRRKIREQEREEQEAEAEAEAERLEQLASSQKPVQATLTPASDPRPSFSTFVAIIVFAYDDLSDEEDEDLEQSDNVVLVLVFMMAFQQRAQVLLQHEQSVQAAYFPNELVPETVRLKPAASRDSSFTDLASSAFGAAFGSPLHLLRPSVPRAPNPCQIFAPNYYRPAAPRPLEAPRNEQRLKAVGFPDELIPEAFQCELRSMVMDNPVKLPQTGQICDGRSVLEALRRKPENPYNRQPMKMEDATPDLQLRQQINSYVEAVEQGVKDKRTDLGSQTLSPADYQAIHDSALKASTANQDQAALRLR